VWVLLQSLARNSSSQDPPSSEQNLNCNRIPWQRDWKQTKTLVCDTIIKTSETTHHPPPTHHNIWETYGSGGWGEDKQHEARARQPTQPPAHTHHNIWETLGRGGWGEDNRHAPRARQPTHTHTHTHTHPHPPIPPPHTHSDSTGFMKRMSRVEHGTLDPPWVVIVVYYESIKRELKIKLIYECRCVSWILG
jgi:hypothetical protein